MKSFSGMSWKIQAIPERLILKKQQDLNISYLLSKIFLQREFSNDEIHNSLNKNNYLNISYQDVDLLRAANLLTKCIKQNQKQIFSL